MIDDEHHYHSLSNSAGKGAPDMTVFSAFLVTIIQCLGNWTKTPPVIFSF